MRLVMALDKSSTDKPALPTLPFSGTALTPTFAHVTTLMPFLLVLAAFVFFGLTGHDPWKADEPYVFGIVHSMLDHDSWLIPMVGGEPFMEKPPLYAWVAAILVRCLGRWMTAPDAARLASGLFMSVTCWALASAARHWWGGKSGRYAPLLLIACLGLLVQSHMMMPDIALVTGFAVATWGWSRIDGDPIGGGILLGLGVGITFLAKGLLGPAVLGLTGLLLPLCFGRWRTTGYRNALAAALPTALPLLVIWPLLLYWRSPALFMEWFWDNNFGRYFGSSPVSHGTEHAPYFWCLTLPWFTFPVLPLAVHGLWHRRRELVTSAALQCTVTMAAVLLAVLWTSASARAVYALPLLVPLAILAVPSAVALRGWTAGLCTWASIVLHGALSAMLWLGWLLMMATGATPRWSWLMPLLPADFKPAFEPGPFLLAALATVLTAAALRASSWLPRAGRALITWVLGLTLVWTLLSTLWMPWLDYAKSYTKVFGSIPWPVSYDCITSIHLGESERAMLHYVNDRITHRQEVFPKSECSLLFVQGYVHSGPGDIDAQRWVQVWSGARPGDGWQRFWLFRARSALDTAQAGEPLPTHVN